MINILKMYLFITAFCLAQTAQAEYDPLLKGESGEYITQELNVCYGAADREIPVLVYRPENAEARRPAILFSHGLGGSRYGCEYLGRHWAGAGFVCFFLQHPGSDSSIWEDLPAGERLKAFNQAANGKNYMHRINDVRAVLDFIEKKAKQKHDSLGKIIDPNSIGMSGHSFGAVTTQAVSGLSAWNGRKVYSDDRIRAAIALSPSVPKNSSADEAFGSVNRPWMLMTGTKDQSIIGTASPEERLKVYEALPAGDKYQIVLHNGKHLAFTDRQPRKWGKRNPNHHTIIKAASTAFWDSYLKNDPQAKEWLDGDKIAAILEPKDKWQKK
ncbi:putative dienelactone hydrolase [Sedimentisphaera cyanobacteriorum]|uniref:Putative dienelactone hydrolase n=1 Tax=Sedimentisphaera cyanobacteriorum TaxID=1940790 RepID=A0A1Q2HR37_9BACT|nr:hypothetical protein [Sedimentisphaera cyanobacteriorum]AQQ09917.1 putative dienelactone hydrolase [Sedimentisphaera cyanobacteriorum]